MSRVCAYKSLDRGAFLAFRRTMWTNHIIAHGSRNNKSFRVVDNERRKLPGRALNHGLLPLAEVQNIHAPVRGVIDRGGEPVPPCLDEFTFMEPGALFAPARAFGDGINNLDQIFLDPLCCPVPLDVSKPMLEMDWEWGAVQAYPSPVPHFEGEDIRRRADFKHHAVLARAVRGSGRN